MLQRIDLCTSEAKEIYITGMVVGNTRRGAGEGVGDQSVKPGDWELGDHVTEILFRL